MKGSLRISSAEKNNKQKEIHDLYREKKREDNLQEHKEKVDFKSFIKTMI